MKIIVTGSLGNVSRPLAQELVRQGHAVTVISSNPEKQPAIEALGATAAIGSLEDADFLTATFADADAVYTMVPPSFTAPDLRAYSQRLAHGYARAIRQTHVPRVVQLSSWGAHLSEGTGPILGSHDVEGILRELTDVAVTFLRPTSFYTNLYSLVGMIKARGVMGVNYGGEVKVALVHPRDIAAAAAEELTTPATGHGVRYVASDERTADETARVLGAALGRPKLAWVALTDEQMQAGLESNGVPAHRAAEVVELYASIRSGALGTDYEQHKPVLGKVKLEDFAQEFAAAF